MQTILINFSYFDYNKNLGKNNLLLEYRYDAN